MMDELGLVKELDPYAVWQGEATDFTPWLADNLDYVGSALGMDLELVGTEVPVGGFRIDIVAQEVGTDHVVVIENQLGATDHDHLGKVMTYAAGQGANHAVWIAPRFRAEHLSAIRWINESTIEDVGFFALRIDTFRVDDSRPALKLIAEAQPDAWSKRSRVAVKEGLSERQQRYRDFWEPVLEGVKERWPDWTNSRTPSKESWMELPAGRTGIYFGISFTGDPRLRMELYVDPHDETLRGRAFDMLSESREPIETALNSTLSWEELPSSRASRIALYYPQPASVIHENEWAAYREWLFGNLGDFRAVLQPYVSALGSGRAEAVGSALPSIPTTTG